MQRLYLRIKCRQAGSAIIGGLIVFAAGLGSTGDVRGETPREHTVLVSAEIRTEPPRVLLEWEADPKAESYQISRTNPNLPDWVRAATLPGTAAMYIDDSVSAGGVYEYQIIKEAPKYTGYGYIRVGVEAPLIDERGKVLLVIANTHARELEPELARLQQDLVGDGWLVDRQMVRSDQDPAEVKALIKRGYDAEPTLLKAVLLFGNVPVPYSGEISPDGHANHRGAWPADVYYGDMHGLWTDSSVTSTNAERHRNWNVPGDGKFDQDTPPGNVVIQVGRVDLSNLTCFSNKNPSRSEKDLLRQYLNKNHNFRHGRLAIERQGLICDNFSDKGRDPIGCSGWRNFSSFFGANGIREVGWSNYFPTVTNEGFLWTFASGGGQYYTCTGVGSSDDFALQDIRAVFTMWLGSYFGDWDNESNLLRAALGSSTYTLTATYSGFPQWLYHPMAVGETIGYCAQLTQNNRPRGFYPPYNPGSSQVHVALLGDPTLRMHPVLPPSQLSATAATGGTLLTWSPSPEPELLGYHVYRAASPAGPFTRITGPTPLSETAFQDSPRVESATYMVRAVKRERSSSGTYFNASQGIFAQIPVQEPSGNSSGGPTLSIQSAKRGTVHLRLTGKPGQAIRLESSEDLRHWQEMLNESSSAGTIEFAEPTSAQRRFYRSR